MASYDVHIAADCYEELDGSLTVVVEISGLPDVDAANKISDWLKKIIKDNANTIGLWSEGDPEVREIPIERH